LAERTLDFKIRCCYRASVRLAGNLQSAAKITACDLASDISQVLSER
jgi:hypothetical protein